MAKYIVTAFVLFASFIFYMVVQTFLQPVNMVSKNYYAEELAYDALQKANKRWASLHLDPAFASSSGRLILSFDGMRFDSSSTVLYSTTGKLKDVYHTVLIPHEKIEIPIGNSPIGEYQMKFKGYSVGELYYFEKQFR